MQPTMTRQEALQRIQWELTLVMGPLAPVIVRNKATEFGNSTEDFPQDRLAELVEEVSFEVQNPRRKVEFQRAALKILKETPIAGDAQRPLASFQDHVLRLKPEEEAKPVRKSTLRLAKLEGPEGTS
jgi:hypothetical protein